MNQPHKKQPKKQKLVDRVLNFLGAILKPSPIKISLLVMLLCLGLLLRHYRVQVNRDSIDIIAEIERRLFDLRTRFRGQQEITQKVGVLAVDEESIAMFGRWPFDRSVYAQSFQNLKAAGVQWIGFDVIFSEDQDPGLMQSAPYIAEAISESLNEGGQFNGDKFNEQMNTLLQQSPSDLSLVQAIQDFENIVQGYFVIDQVGQVKALKRNWVEDFQKLMPSALDFIEFSQPSMKLTDYPELFKYGAITNTSLIAQASDHHAYFSNPPEPDGVIRKVSLVQGLYPVDQDAKPMGEPILLPSLSLSLAMKHLKREALIKVDERGVYQIDLMDPDAEREVLSIPMEGSGSGQMLLKHYGGQGTFPHVSLADAYEGKLDPKKVPKVLILGGVATGINDNRPSPFDAQYNGVEHHVTAVENIIRKDFMKRPEAAPFYEIGALIISGILITLLLAKTSSLSSVLAIAGFLVSYVLVDRFYIFGEGYWLYLGMPFIQAFTLYTSVTLFKYFTEEREKKKVKNAFQHYLNPQVVNELMENPDMLKLGGQKKELTVFFSDVRNFTTISETLSPEALTVLLNEYFTPMTQLVLESNGLLDKYIGDAMMAVWGAPISIPDHADRALRASISMIDILGPLQKHWRERGLPFVDIGIGLNTGYMTVGNMGSDQRFDYTVLGDSVNLGARLEGINKQYGTRIICSEFTKAKLVRPNDFALRTLDNIKVKGKNEPVRIFEVMNVPAGAEARFKELIEIFEEGFLAYTEQRWNDSERLLCECLRLKPDDGPSLAFLERLKVFKESSPGESWDGVWVMKTK